MNNEKILNLLALIHNENMYIMKFMHSVSISDQDDYEKCEQNIQMYAQFYESIMGLKQNQEDGRTTS